MKAEVNKRKIIDLVEATKYMNVYDAVSYIRNVFPPSEYEQESINKSNYFMIDRRDIFYLSDDCRSQLVIRYPGGDRLGSKLALPKTDIYLTNKIMEANNDCYPALYLFMSDKYNENNDIRSFVDELVDGKQLTKEDVLTVLKGDCDPIPVKFLGKVDVEILKDKDVKMAIVHCVKNNAIYLRQEAKDISEYGADITGDNYSWKKSESAQFEKIINSLPANVKNVCREEILLTWANLSDTKERYKSLENKVAGAVKEVSELKANKDKYVLRLKQEETVLDKYASYIFLGRSIRQELNFDSPSLLTRHLIDRLSFQADMISDTEKKIAAIALEKNELENRKFSFWQRKEKNDTIAKIKELEIEFEYEKETSILQREKYDELSKFFAVACDFENDVREMQKTNSMDNVKPLFQYSFMQTIDMYEIKQKEYQGEYTKKEYNDIVINTMEKEIAKLPSLEKELESIRKRLLICEKLRVTDVDVADVKGEKVIEPEHNPVWKRNENKPEIAEAKTKDYKSQGKRFSSLQEMLNAVEERRKEQESFEKDSSEHNSNERKQKQDYEMEH